MDVVPGDVLSGGLDPLQGGRMTPEEDFLAKLTAWRALSLDEQRIALNGGKPIPKRKRKKCDCGKNRPRGNN